MSTDSKVVVAKLKSIPKEKKLGSMDWMDDEGNEIVVSSEAFATMTEKPKEGDTVEFAVKKENGKSYAININKKDSMK
ncbi:hypothetical protein [Pseudomonas shirazensis]|uniref:hypothetical protein n=1 Tax=Pseudomonas shirazensis TaxID=2745494 RepID=UPI003D2B5356